MVSETIELRKESVGFVKSTSNLEAAYAHMNFGSLATYAGKLHEEREITESKRNTKVETGTSRQAGVVTSTASEKPMSIREAFANAKKQHGT